MKFVKSFLCAVFASLCMLAFSEEEEETEAKINFWTTFEVDDSKTVTVTYQNGTSQTFYRGSFSYEEMGINSALEEYYPTYTTLKSDMENAGLTSSQISYNMAAWSEMMTATIYKGVAEQNKIDAARIAAAEGDTEEAAEAVAELQKSTSSNMEDLRGTLDGQLTQLNQANSQLINSLASAVNTKTAELEDKIEQLQQNSGADESTVKQLQTDVQKLSQEVAANNKAIAALKTCLKEEVASRLDDYVLITSYTNTIKRMTYYLGNTNANPNGIFMVPQDPVSGQSLGDSATIDDYLAVQGVMAYINCELAEKIKSTGSRYDEGFKEKLDEQGVTNVEASFSAPINWADGSTIVSTNGKYSIHRNYQFVTNIIWATNWTEAVDHITKEETQVIVNVVTNLVDNYQTVTTQVFKVEAFTNWYEMVDWTTNVTVNVISQKTDVVNMITNTMQHYDFVTNFYNHEDFVTNTFNHESFVTNCFYHEYFITNTFQENHISTTTNMWDTYDAVEKSNAITTNFLFGSGGGSNLIQNVHALTNDLRVAMLGYDDSSITAVTNEYAAEGAPSRLLQIKGWLTQQSGCIGELGNVLSAATNTTMYTDKTNVSLLVRHVIHPESGSTETNDTVVLHYMPIGDLATNNPDNKSITLNSLDGTNSALAVSGWGSTSYDEDIDLFRYMADKTYTNFNGHLLYRPMDSTNNPMGYLKIKGGTLTNIFEYASNSIAVVKFLDNVSISSNSDTRVQIYGFEEANDGDVPMVCTSEDTNTVKHIIWTNLTEKITSDVATNIADNASISTNSDYKIQIYDFENADEGDIPMVVKIGDENKICWTNYTTNVVYVDGRSIENPDDLDGDGKRRLQLIDFKEPPEQTMNFSDLIESDGDESEDGEYKVLVRHTTKNQSGSNTCELLYLDTTNSVLGGKWAKSKTGRNGLSGISSYFGEDDAQLGSNITAIAMVADKLLDLYSITTNNNGLLQLQGFANAGIRTYPMKYATGENIYLKWVYDDCPDGDYPFIKEGSGYNYQSIGYNTATNDSSDGRMPFQIYGFSSAEDGAIPYKDDYGHEPGGTPTASKIGWNTFNEGVITNDHVNGIVLYDFNKATEGQVPYKNGDKLAWTNVAASVTVDNVSINNNSTNAFQIAGFSGANQGQVPYKNGEYLEWTNVTSIASGAAIVVTGTDGVAVAGTNITFTSGTNVKTTASGGSNGSVSLKVEVYWE